MCNAVSPLTCVKWESLAGGKLSRGYGDASANTVLRHVAAERRCYGPWSELGGDEWARGNIGLWSELAGRRRSQRTRRGLALWAPPALPSPASGPRHISLRVASGTARGSFSRGRCLETVLEILPRWEKDKEYGIHSFYCYYNGKLAVLNHSKQGEEPMISKNYGDVIR